MGDHRPPCQTWQQRQTEALPLETRFVGWPDPPLRNAVERQRQPINMTGNIAAQGVSGNGPGERAATLSRDGQGNLLAV